MPTSSPIASPTTSATASPSQDLYLHYATNGESYYTDIRIEAGTLTYTYFSDDENRCAQWFKSEPCWSDADLKTITHPLDNQAETALRQLVTDSGILSLGAELLGAHNPKQRAYSEKLEVRLGNDEHQLVYRSRPDAPAKPEPFRQLEEALQQQAQQLLQNQTSQ